MSETTTRPVSGLAAMKLDELKGVATSMGIKGTGKMRKSDLVEAIKARQSGGSAPAAAPAALPATAASASAAPTAASVAPPSTSDSVAPVEANAATKVGSTAGSPEHPQRDSSQRRVSRRVQSAQTSLSESTGDLSTTPSAAPITENAQGSSDREAAAPTPTADADQPSGSTETGGTSETSSRSATSEAQDPSETGQIRSQERRQGRVTRSQREARESREPREEPRLPEGMALAEAAVDNLERAERGEVTRPQRETRQERQDRLARERQDGQQRDRQDTHQRELSDSASRPPAQVNQPAGAQSRFDDEDGPNGTRRSRNRQRSRDRKRGRTRDGQEWTEPEEQVQEDDVLVPVAGILDVLDNYAFVRTTGYLAGPDDVYVPLGIVKKHGLRKGDAVAGAVKALREGEQPTGNVGRQKFNALVRLDSVNGATSEEALKRVEFGKLTPLYPQDRLRLETESTGLTTRIIDLVAPIGKGQRGLVVAPAKAGTTMVVQAMANAITTNNPECHLMVVLIDERPEEVTEMQRAVKGEVIASTFDRPAEDHTTVAELAIERAKRLVELGHDVVLLLDGITRLGRAYNLAAPTSGRIMSGGVDSSAL
ncbi:MAG: transcription termination factor Rho, partial [Humibacillus sp.]